MTLTEILLTALLGAVGSLCGILWSMMRSRVSEVEKRAEESDRRLAQADRNLAEFKLQVAYASKEYITTQQMGAFIESLTKFKEVVFEKLDTIDGDMRKMFEVFRDKLEKKQDREGHL